jgi:hypothetical protein
MTQNVYFYLYDFAQMSGRMKAKLAKKLNQNLPGDPSVREH